MQTLKRIFIRNISFYLILVIVAAASVDWQKCFHQRGKYLLGIFYNGYFQNSRDGIVYQDFLKRHHTTHDAFLKTI